MLFLVLFLILIATFSAVTLMFNQVKRKWIAVGTLCLSIPFMASTAIGFSYFHQKIPYNKEPAVISGVEDISEYPAEGITEPGIISVYTVDGSKYEEPYSELRVMQDGKNQIDIYSCGDDGFFWAGFKKRQRIVIHA